MNCSHHIEKPLGFGCTIPDCVCCRSFQSRITTSSYDTHFQSILLISFHRLLLQVRDQAKEMSAGSNDSTLTLANREEKRNLLVRKCLIKIFPLHARLENNVRIRFYGKMSFSLKEEGESLPCISRILFIPDMSIHIPPGVP